MAKITKQTSLYTLIVNPDQTFDLRIDGKSVKSGSLLEDFSPSVNPPAEIEDPSDKKPENWVEEAQIADPEAKKPEDWDEDAPFEIVDEDAVKPADWLEDEPEFIPDPDAVKPEDWDDDEDGDWIAPTVPNPKCEEASGCGKWSKPLKPNSAYKGKWAAPLIENPEYKGPWSPRQIPNPAYFEDKTPANFEPIGAIGFELWTMTKDILFDNIYVGHSIEDAEKLKKETFDVKKAIEEAEEATSAPKEEPFKPVPTFKEDPVAFIRAQLEPFVNAAQQDFIGAIKAFPEIAGGIGAFLVTLLALLFGLVTLATSPTKVKKVAAAVPEKKEGEKEATKVEGSSSETEKPKTTRRTSKKA